MNVVDVVLSTEVIAGIIIIGALVMSVRSILIFTRDASSMAPKLQRIEVSLNKQREGMDERKKIVRELSQVVDPLKERESRLRVYFEGLKNLELAYERESAEQQAKEESEKRKRIQRKKMGFD